MMNDDQDMLMPVALDRLRAFYLNPRITRNHDELKELIRYHSFLKNYYIYMCNYHEFPVWTYKLKKF